MLRLLKRLYFILFFGLLGFFTIFYVPKDYYTEWAVTFVFFVLFLIYNSFKIVMSKKKEELFKELVLEYKDILKNEEKIRSESIKMDFTCPACETKNTFWLFLENYKCPKCSSGLWTTTLKDVDDVYQDLFKKREKVFYFYDKLPGRDRRRLKKIELNGFK